MSLPTFNRGYAHWRALRQLVDIAVDRYEYASAEMVVDHFGGDPDAFSEYLATNPNGVGVPTREHMHELIDLIVNTSLNNFVLSYEDRDFLGRVRSHLCDAFVACMDGDVESVAEATTKAYQQLHFITYGRKRTDKRDFNNPFAAERPKFEKLTARASKLARSLDLTSVSA